MIPQRRIVQHRVAEERHVIRLLELRIGHQFGEQDDVVLVGVGAVLVADGCRVDGGGTDRLIFDGVCFPINRSDLEVLTTERQSVLFHQLVHADEMVRVERLERL